VGLISIFVTGVLSKSKEASVWTLCGEGVDWAMGVRSCVVETEGNGISFGEAIPMVVEDGLGLSEEG
jgi:hypothetical protein